VVYVFVA